MKLDFANVFIVSCVIGGLAFFYYINEKKDNDIVKKLVSSYKYGSSDDIEIIKTFEDKGKKVYMLKIGRDICEMPTIKINGNLTSTGITCTR
ncbi:hypothetical protein [Aliarcobacter trophiarum]|uniref:hypothetical protein n=1 Tax=Aliarcobacter trophiarum TaxID=708186 RepID=UPI00100AA2B2|nr:hypothetical protein [Aliarcobacter trophiarum]RXI28534.1 hypothetical protein CRU89_00855 [Aliarcobacter trophiarum]